MEARPDEDLSLEGQRLRSAISSTLFGDDEAPIKIGRFVVVGRLGEGAMGVVYSAYDPDLDRRVAVKVIRPHLLTGLKAEARFRREAKALAKLNHPNVVTVFEVGESDGHLFLALEFVSGSTLSQWCQREEFTGSDRAQQLLRFAAQSARGLAAAHERGLVHRDFKPSNLLVGDDERIRIADFGLAAEQSIPEDSLHESLVTQSDVNRTPADGLTGTGRTVGTPAYMAPEQLNGAAEVRSDQFAWAVTFYQAFTSVRPFAGSTLGEILDNARAQRIDSSKAHLLPPKLKPILEKALRYEPGERYDSMLAVVDALQAATRRRVSWLALGGVGVALAAVASFATVAQLQAQAESTCANEADELSEHWNEERRGKLAAQLDTIGLRFGTEALDRTSRTLEAYQAQWSEARKSACLATTQSDPLLGERLSCLSRRAQAFETATDSLLEVHAGTLVRSIAVVDELPAIDTCNDDAWLAATVKPPDDPATAQAVEAVRDLLVAAQTLRRAGRMEDARVNLDEAESEIADLEYPAITGEVLATRGELELELGEIKAAEGNLKAAFTAAGRAGDDRTASYAATSLVRVVGDHLQRYDEAELWSELSETMLIRAKAGGTLAHARLLSIRATVLRSGGDYKAGMAEHRRAVEVARSAIGEKNPSLGGYMIGEAHALFFGGEVERAREVTEQVRALYVETLGPNHPLLGHCALLLGSIEIRQGNFAGALPELGKAADIFEGAYGAEHRKYAETLVQLGMTHYNLANYREAQQHHERALEIQRSSLGESHPDVAALMLNLANVYIDIGETAKAIEMLLDSRKNWAAAKGPADPSLRVFDNNLGRAYLSTKSYDQALKYYEQALANPAAKQEDPPLAATLTGLGRAWLAKDDAAKARPYLERSLKILEATPVGLEQLAAAHYFLGIAMVKTGDAKASVDHIRAARAGYADVGATEIVDEIDEFASVNGLEV